jgi:hypothetical protein
VRRDIWTKGIQRRFDPGYGIRLLHDVHLPRFMNR